MSTDFRRIDESIGKLRELLDILDAELRERARDTHALPTDARLCKESLLTINVLLPKLEATRAALAASTVPTLEELAPRYSLCVDCDDA